MSEILAFTREMYVLGGPMAVALLTMVVLLLAAAWAAYKIIVTFLGSIVRIGRGLSAMRITIDQVDKQIRLSFAEVARVVRRREGAQDQQHRELMAALRQLEARVADLGRPRHDG